MSYTNDQTAAEALVNLQSRSTVSWSHGDADYWRRTNDPVLTKRHGYQNLDGSVYSRPTESGTLAYQGNTTMSQNVNPLPHASLYSNANIQNTIAGLGNAMESMQNQQAYMHTKQETISNALKHVMVMLQTLNKEKQTPTKNNVNTCASMGQSESRISAFTQNDMQEGNSTEGNRVHNRQGHEIRDEDISELRHSYQYEETNPHHRERPQYTPYSTDYPPRRENGAQEPSRYRAVFSNDLHYTNSSGTENRGQEAESMVENQEEDTSNMKPNYRYEESNLQHSEGARRAPYHTYYPPRRSGYERPQGERRQSTCEPNDVKLPPFNGKEDWKVWVNRFEAVADRRRWDEETKLDHLLPKLQGKAGDFVFTQLPRRTLTSYNELIKELNSRFRIVETKKTYAARFSQRTQTPGETAEEFAAELKRLYAKAYEFRDEQTRQEDLVRRFLDGLRDSEARFEIEYNKEPDDIDEAVYHAVNFIQTRHRSSADGFSDRKTRKFARKS